MVIDRAKVYWVSDSDLKLLEPKGTERKKKITRPFLVLSTNTLNHHTSFEFITGIPLSTSPHFATPYDVELFRGVANLKEDSFVRPALIQTIHKDLVLKSNERAIGTVPLDKLLEIEAMLLEHLSLDPE